MKAFFSRLHLGSNNNNTANTNANPNTYSNTYSNPNTNSNTNSRTNTPNASREKEIGKLPASLRTWPPVSPAPAVTPAALAPAPVRPESRESSTSQYAVYKPLPEVGALGGGDILDSEDDEGGGTPTKKAVAFVSSQDLEPLPENIGINRFRPTQNNSSQQSLRSGTPFSQMTSHTASTHVLSATSWSQVTEDELVSNLGARERTRQEVLFEIIQSEERYVGELGKMREMFIDPLLHPYSERGVGMQGGGSGSGEGESLPPIAARFMSPTPARGGDSSEDEDEDDNTWRTDPRSPYRGVPIIPFPSGARSHQSLPPASKLLNGVSTQSLGERRRAQSISGVPPHLLPPDLRICLEVIDSGVFEGHKRLAEALRKRYDDQYPLVRSLADVFVANSDIFSGYATYVLHLERALDQVDSALKSPLSKPRSSHHHPHSSNTIPVLLRTLDLLASNLGHTSLAISLSKPFQRLLKYPLLFQNLLYHTDPSTVEYESTLQMVAEIEVMVRGIEDEKVEWEDREKTRDVLGRIEWGEGNNTGGGSAGKEWVGRPKPGRVLLHETVYSPTAPPSSLSPIPIQIKKSKSSFRRLSDALSPKAFSKKDLWVVHFNDVVLLCQRTGLTTVPIWSSTSNNNTGSGDHQTKEKGRDWKGKDPPGGQGKRQLRTVTPRNLYRFIKVETWVIGDVVQPREGVVAMADIERARLQRLHSSHHPRIIPMPPDDENPSGAGLRLRPPHSPDSDSDPDSSDSDRKSKMSFSYWGADKVTIQRPPGAGGSTTKVVIRGGARGGAGTGRVRSTNLTTRSLTSSSTGPPPHRSSGGAPQGRIVVPSRRGGGGYAIHGHVIPPSAYSRESSANAKFGSRLVSERERDKERPSSRRTGTRSRTATVTSTTAADTAKSSSSTPPLNSNSNPNSNPNNTPTTLPLPSRITPSTSQTSARSRRSSQSASTTTVPAPAPTTNTPTPALSSTTPTTTKSRTGPISRGPSNTTSTATPMSKSTSTTASTSTSITASTSKSPKSPSSSSSTPVSPAASQDSGVGLYRQMMARDREGGRV
ncbi:hypothetical protein C8R41DRAFT_18 [Lentinula lateritia]|uniref:DH domain-containing protein n=1 Tax=Lentinula lateritia TaxID=40482 RepID=A0ABQ8W186_9AGAR|nr:hypothetical protein C8R41DRAFT_18 [Lentinula lateritia]